MNVEFYYLLSIIILVNLLFWIEIAPVCVCVAVKVVQNFVLQIFEETAMLGNFQTKFPIVRLIHIPPSYNML